MTAKRVPKGPTVVSVAQAPAAVAVSNGNHETGVALMDALMDGEAPVQSADMLIPKALLMQGLSDFVNQEKAKIGEIRDSLDGSLLGSRDKPLEIVAFHSFKSWILYREVKGKQEYVDQVPWTPENDNWPQEEVVEGHKVRRDRALNYYFLLPSEIEAGLYFPRLLSCRRTSYTAGRKIETIRAKLSMFRRPLASKVLTITPKKEENDKGVFYVFDVQESRVTNESELAAVTKWKEILKASKNVRVDDSDLQKTTPDVAPIDTNEY